jgi:hypothetical protein
MAISMMFMRLEFTATGINHPDSADVFAAAGMLPLRGWKFSVELIACRS